MLRDFINALVDQTSQFVLLCCVGIPGAPLDWLSANLPNKVF